MRLDYAIAFLLLVSIREKLKIINKELNFSTSTLTTGENVYVLFLFHHLECIYVQYFFDIGIVTRRETFY